MSMTITAERQCREDLLSPCHDCPWARESIPGWLGSLSKEEWRDLAHSEGRADCHAFKDMDGGAFDCAGMAIYRSNVLKRVRDKNALRLPANPILVFSNPGEFLEHHGRKGPKT